MSPTHPRRSGRARGEAEVKAIVCHEFSLVKIEELEFYLYLLTGEKKEEH